MGIFKNRKQKAIQALNLLLTTLDGGFQQQLLAHFQIGHKQPLCYCAASALRLFLYERPELAGDSTNIAEHIYGVVNIKNKMIVHLETEPRNNSRSAFEICTRAQSRPFISTQKKDLPLL